MNFYPLADPIDQPIAVNRFADRMADDDAAQTRWFAAIETDARRRARERDEARERLGVVITPLADDGAYAQLAAKHLDIGTRRSKLDREQVETVAALARGMAAHRGRQLEQQAQSIIDGENTTEVFKGFEELKARSTRLDSECRAYAEAMRMVKADMDRMRDERSAVIAGEVAPTHARAVGAIADACDVLLAALRDEAYVREIVTTAGYHSRLPVFQGFASIDDLAARARAYSA